MVEGKVVDSNMDGFSSISGNMFAVLVYYLAVGDVDSWVFVGNATFVNWPVDITIVFLYFPNI